MKATKENIESLKELGFKEIKKGTYVFMDVKAIVSDVYLSFYYLGKSFPIISKIESVEKIIQGIYEYKFLDNE